MNNIDDNTNSATTTSEPLPPPFEELIIGLIGACGTDFTKTITTIKQAVSDNNTVLIEVIHLIELLDKYDHRNYPYDASDISKLMDYGNTFRSTLKKRNALAALGLSSIIETREQIIVKDEKNIKTVIYLVRSLKTPAEVEYLRKIYGDSFLAISVFSSEDIRRKYLEKIIKEFHRDRKITSKHRMEAQALIERDQKEEANLYGQAIRDTFPKADFFLDIDKPTFKESVCRLFNLIFGSPFITPSRDEYGMFHAFAASLRSSDLSRQVGASVTNKEGDILCLGCNDVPKYGGGQYWEGDDPDKRDFQLGADSNELQRRALITDVIEKFKENKWLAADKDEENLIELVEEAISGPLADAEILSITEYGRSVHAEMSLVTDAASRGISLKNAILYTTTFPCHNCARHIIATGIKRIVYIEPYPKSFTTELHDDSISHDPRDRDSKVLMQSFVGLAPTVYISYFQAADIRKKHDGKINDWLSQEASLKHKGNPLAYLAFETQAHKEFSEVHKEISIL